MPHVTDPNVLVGLTTSDDAAVYRITDDLAAVLTADFITPIVDDAYEFGRIAVANALSDIYAMGARPVLGLNLVAFPARTLPLERLMEIMRGGADQASAAGVSIVGGHSIDDPEPKYGLAVLGLVDPKEVLVNSAAKLGDRLILTKPLGTGIVATALKRSAAPPASVAQAMRSMATLNGPAAEVARRVGCSACTDITGFGLLGHLHEMTAGSGVGARVRLSSVPLIDGVHELARADMAPGGTERNLAFLDSEGVIVWSDGIDEYARLVLCDAQTSGGMLLSVSPDSAAVLMDELLAADVLVAADIGEIVTDPDHRIVVEP